MNAHKHTHTQTYGHTYLLRQHFYWNEKLTHVHCRLAVKNSCFHFSDEKFMFLQFYFKVLASNGTKCVCTWTNKDSSMFWCMGLRAGEWECECTQYGLFHSILNLNWYILSRRTFWNLIFYRSYWKLLLLFPFNDPITVLNENSRI